jgi:alanyl-tRNA synthetase
MYSNTQRGGVERLYYTDAYQRTFTARVTAITPGDGPGRGARVVLDRTAFYPTSGGQPHDRGTLAGAPVVDVIDEEDRVVHVLAPSAGEGMAVGAEVQGALDWDRRFDHMQQHTGQHVVSAEFLRVLGAETVSVHLGDTSTLDLDLATLGPEEARRVEEAANQVVFENRPVTVRFIDAGAAESIGLRRPPRRTGLLRVVEVEGCDWSACGGTHVRATAEIGPILLRRWERTRERIRVEFLCGWRAVRDYWGKHGLVSAWSARLGVGERELGAALDRLATHGQERDRAFLEARKRLVSYEAAERLAATSGHDPRIIRLDVRGREPDEVRMLLRALTSQARCIVLAGDGDTGRLYFSRSSGEGPDMAALLGRVCTAEGGRGGGSREFGQGAVPPGQGVARALSLAEHEVGRA